MHEHHRERMYERLFSAPESLCEHELLEILLFSILPRVNTNEIAHELLDRFGSVHAVLHASPEELQNVPGVGRKSASFLVTVGAVLGRLAEKREDIPKVFNPEQFSDYLRSRYAGLNSEVFDIYFIDRANTLLGSYRISSDLSDRVIIEPKKLITVIASSRASAVVLAHNHLGATPRPSSADDALTRQCQLICSMCNIKLLDHFIYSDRWIYSYHSDGRMEHVMQYNVENLMNQISEGEL